MTDTPKLVVTVARALARSHGLGDHMTNLDPWMRDAKTAVDAIAASEQAAARRALEMAAEVAEKHYAEFDCLGDRGISTEYINGHEAGQSAAADAIALAILAINPSEGTEP